MAAVLELQEKDARKKGNYGPSERLQHDRTLRIFTAVA
jgi:hypothetical protein